MGIPRPADMRAVRQLDQPPPPCRQGPGRRRAASRLRVLSRAGRQHAVEPRHHDPPLPPLRPPGRHHQLAQGAPALLGHRAPHAGVDLNTVAGRLGHAEGSTTLKFYAQFTATADQHAATIIPSQLDTLRKKERLRELYLLEPAEADHAELAARLAQQAGLDRDIALSLLAELAAGPARAG